MSVSSLTAEQETLLRKYTEAVVKAPHHLSLTATRDPDEFWKRHILDALALIDLLPEKDHESSLQVIDVGSGNGIPGIPLAVARPFWQLKLLDSNSKKCGFIDTFCKFNSIKNVRVLAGRAEVFGQDPHYREQQDLVVARALSKLPVALELSSGFAKVGGQIIVPHGTTAESELARSEKTMKELQLKIHGITTYYENYQAIIIDKIDSTPAKYPRAIGIPEKKPL